MLGNLTLTQFLADKLAHRVFQAYLPKQTTDFGFELLDTHNIPDNSNLGATFSGFNTAYNYLKLYQPQMKLALNLLNIYNISD